jgi:hypothetical protein
VKRARPTLAGDSANTQDWLGLPKDIAGGVNRRASLLGLTAKEGALKHVSDGVTLQAASRGELLTLCSGELALPKGNLSNEARVASM